MPSTSELACTIGFSAALGGCQGYQPDGQPAVICPEPAAFRKLTIASGAPRSFIYYDILGRTIYSPSETLFDDAPTNQNFSLVCTEYDSHNGVIRAAEPVFSSIDAGTGEPTAGVGFAGCNGFATSTTFDVIGRTRTALQPDSGLTQITYGTDAKVVNLGGNNYTEYRAKTNKRAPDNVSQSNRVWIDLTNAAGEKIQFTDPNGFVVNQRFDEAGNLTDVWRQTGTSNPVILSSVLYDNLGRKIVQVDPDMGTWQYAYNALGELVSQTDAKNQVTTHLIDAVGRVWKTTMPGFLDKDQLLRAGFEDSDVPPGSSVGVIVDTVTYDTAANGLGMVSTSRRTEPNAADYTRSFIYDSLSRVGEAYIEIDGLDYVRKQAYDSIGRVFKQYSGIADLVYQEVYEIAFNSKGYAHKICRAEFTITQTNCNVSNSDLYYQALEFSPRGQVTRERMANNVSLEVGRSFDAQTGRLNVQNVGNGGGLQNWQFLYDAVGNLRSRFDAATGQTETFAYDKLDRLSTVTSNSTISMQLQYDSLGNICQKTKGASVANYQYGLASNCQFNNGIGTSPHQVKSVLGNSYVYDANGDLDTRTGNGSTLTMAYDASRLTRSLSSEGAVNARSTFFYGPSGRYKRIDTKNGSTTRIVTYAFGAEREFANNQTLVRESVGGFLLINSVITPTLTTRNYRYQFGYHLGSVDLITSETGAVIEKMSFDAHGSRRQVSLWLNPVVNYIPSTTLRGFTGHEMLDDLGLIHMNARIYDPELGKFLQADSMVEPDATQGLNRYSYVLNNPLSTTDPTGNLSKNSLGILKSLVSIGISFFLPGSGFLFTANSFGSYVFAGFISGAITGGLEGGLWGAFSAGLFNKLTPGLEKLAKTNSWSAGTLRAAKVLTHATAGGALSALQGGKFGHGFISAGITEALGPAIDHISSGYGEVAARAMLGGSMSALVGGKFANGAASGAFGFIYGAIKRDIALKNQGSITLELSDRNAEDGYDTADDAAKAQYNAYDDVYKGTVGKEREVAGALISREGRYYFTTVAVVDAKYRARYLPGDSIKKGYAWAGFTHTHPDNTSFNGKDFEQPVNSGHPYYVRTSRGRIYRWDVEGAQRYADSKDAEALRSARGNLFETEITDPKKWGIANVCGPGCAPKH